MKLNLVALGVCIVGALAVPAWDHRDEYPSDVQHYKEQGNDLYFCKSGWELLEPKHHGYGLVVHDKRTLKFLDKILDALKKLLDKVWNDYLKLKKEMEEKKKDYDDKVSAEAAAVSHRARLTPLAGERI